MPWLTAVASLLATGCGRCYAEEICTAPSDTTARPEMTDEEFEAELRSVKCGLYVAPSTIEGAGNGVYTVLDLPRAWMSLGSDLPILTVYNTKLSQPWGNYEHRLQPPLEYEDNGAMGGGILIMGAGIMCNSIPGQTNAGGSEISVDVALDARKDPGAGAFSDYHVSLMNGEVLAAGDEIFLDYGEGWLEARGIMDDAGAAAAAGGPTASTARRRSVKWIEENGYCIDHMYVKKSTVLQAGRGAFARRPIPAGDAIISAQMLPIKGGKEVLRRRTDVRADAASPTDRQQITNYVYSHPDSSVLFLPTSLATVINHRSSSSVKKGEGPNVVMRWSTNDKKTRHLLSVPPEKLLTEVMIMDFVATRDIAVDEEIFVDYGDKWQDAWDKHVAHWIPPKDATATSAEVSAMNSNKFDRDNWAWTDAHFTVCIYNGVEMQGLSLEEEFVTDRMGVDHNHLGFQLLGAGSERVPCLVGKADEKAGTFDVFYFVDQEDERLMGFVSDLPASDLTFVSFPLSSDQHRDDGHRFAHEIEIQNFPEVWKDLLLVS